jgi:integrase
LQKLFAAPLFSGVKSHADWFQAGSVSMHQTGRFWVPLLALHAGARLMEAVQLVREDVGCEDGIWFIDINEDDDNDTGKRVKNESSIRRIPLHPELVRLRFVDFVKTRPAGSRLFPDISIGPETQRHRHASKMFNKLLTSAGVKGPKKVWHSLRHSFEQACRDSRVDSAVMDQLQGHSQKGMRGSYGDGYKLPELNEGIRSIRYSGLDLSHINSFQPDMTDK